MAELTFHVVSGPLILPFIDDLAKLRIQVFREWPYLYDGTLEYEREYLERYANSETSTVVLAFDGERTVGASTGIPLLDADEAFSTPFLGSDFSPEDIYYFGESVLLAEFRGAGIGRAFFHYREMNARELGYKYAAFCAVERAAEDPRKPENYVSLDAMWLRNGFIKQEAILARFPWKETHSEDEVENQLSFWVKHLV